MKRIKKTLLQSAALTTVICLPAPALAQIEEIVVTAQKREQSIQDVPTSIVAVTGDEMLDRQLAGPADLADALPNVFVSKDTVSNNIYVRGVGSGANAGFEQAVPTFVDGVYHGRSRYAQSSIVDVQRVEVLRGPQTIYFGNNAIGGAFSVITNAPDLNDWGGYGVVSYEFEGKEPVVQAAVGGPIIPGKLAVRVAGRYSHLDGYIKNTGTGVRNSNVEDRFVRFSALWQVSDTWATTFKAEYGKQDSIAPFAAQLTNCPPAAPFAPGFSCGFALATGQETKFDFKRATSPGERGEVEASEFVFKVERDNIDGPGIVAQGSFSKHDFLVAADTDGVPESFFTFSSPEKLEQSTFELRLTSPSESKLDYIIGFYYLDSKSNIGTNLNFPFANVLLTGPLASLAPFAPLAGVVNLNQKETAFSVFGSVTYPFTDRLSASVGLRYTYSDKEAMQSATNATGNDPYGLSSTPLPDALQPVAAILTGFVDHNVSDSVKDGDFLPSFTLQYEPSYNISLYAKFSEGFKAGGFDAVELTGIPGRLTFNPETVRAYEMGMKSFLMGRTLSLNLSLFRSDYKDLQQSVAQFTPTSAFITVANVGGLKTQGIEAELLWQPNDNITLGADLAHLDASYKNYTNAGCTAAQAAAAAASGAVGCLQDLTGQAPPFAPKWSGNFRAGYKQPISDSLQISANAMLSFSDSYDVITDKDPNTRQGAWQKVDARIGVGDIDGAWELAFIGKNLTNEKVMGSATDVVASSGSYTRTIQRGRTMAVQARVKF